MPEPWAREAYGGVRVLILGASGFIGRWVARALTEAGAELTLVVRSRAAAGAVIARWGVGGVLLEADLTRRDSLADVCRIARPSVTINLAGYGVDPSERDAPTAFAINANLVERLARLLADGPADSWPGQRLVHVGSALEYGDVGGTITEATPPNPTTLYGRSKLRGTELLQEVCRDSRLRAITARLFMIYGAGEHSQRLFPELLREASGSRVLHLTSGEQRRDFTYVEDAAEGLLRLALVKGHPERVVNLGTGRLTRVRDAVEAVAAQLGIPRDRLLFGSLPTRPDEMTRTDGISNERLRHLTNWTPPTALADGIARMIGRHRELADVSPAGHPDRSS